MDGTTSDSLLASASGSYGRPATFTSWTLIHGMHSLARRTRMRRYIRARRASECVPVVTIDPLVDARLTASNALACASGSYPPA